MRSIRRKTYLQASLCAVRLLSLSITSLGTRLATVRFTFAARHRERCRRFDESCMAVG